MPPFEIQVVLPDGSKKALPAGATGADLAKAIGPRLAKAALARDFRRIDPTTARIVLVEAGPRLLPSFPPSLSLHAERALSRLLAGRATAA